MFEHFSALDKIKDPSERGKAILEFFFRKRKFNPFKFAFLVSLNYVVAKLFIAAIIHFYKLFGFQVSKTFVIILLIVTYAPVAVATWVELIKSDLKHYQRLILNIVSNLAIIMVFIRLEKLPMEFAFITGSIVLAVNLLLGLTKIDYEKDSAREKLLVLNMPVAIYLPVGIVAIIAMICIRFIRF